MRKTDFLPEDSLMDWTTKNLRPASDLLLTDCDLLVRTRPAAGGKTCIQLIEIKAKNANIKQHQRFSFGILHAAMNKIHNTSVEVEGVTMHIEYFGYHLLQFSNTTPSNSKEIYWDRKIVTEVQLKDILNYSCCGYCF